MKVWMNRDFCDSTLSACESCFGQFVRTAVPDRACILAYKDDGSDTLTIFMHSGKHNEMIVIPPDMRDEVAYEGWSQFVHFDPKFLHEASGTPEPA